MNHNDPLVPLSMRVTVGLTLVGCAVALIMGACAITLLLLRLR